MDVAFAGGGLFVEDDQVLVSHSVVSDNDAVFGAGLAASSTTSATTTAATVLAELVLHNATLLRNVCERGTMDVSTPCLGGALYCDAVACTASHSLLADNGASRGGGLFAAAFSRAWVHASSVAGNWATAGGGGVWLASSSATVDGGSCLNRNRIVSGSAFAVGGTRGGGLAASDSSVLFQSAFVTGNTADLGAGVQAFNSRLTFRNTRVEGNNVTGGGC